MAKKESVLVFILIVIIVVLSVSMFFWACFVSGSYLERCASNSLLDKLTLTTPGTKLADIKEKLGLCRRKFDKPDEILEWGRVKDKQFCKGKKLYFFDGGTPPCRELDVYTDANDVIVYATWHGL
jgi:hypothetical protein